MIIMRYLLDQPEAAVAKVPATPVPVATATPSMTGSPAVPVPSKSAPAASPTATQPPAPRSSPRA